MTNNNNLPLWFEELKLDSEEISTQDIISQLKQQIPTNFIKLEAQEGNYTCSTNPKWSKQTCERYIFNYPKSSDNWINLDIPHALLESLNLVKGEDITCPIYLDPKVLKKENLCYNAFTLKSKEEIVLVNPNKITVKNQEIQTDLTWWKIDKLEEGENKLEEWTKQFVNETPKQVNDRITSLNDQLGQLKTQIGLSQQDKKLLQQCINYSSTLSSSWNNFCLWSGYHTWFNTSANIENSGAKEEVKNTACHLRNCGNTFKSVIDKKIQNVNQISSLQNQIKNKDKSIADLNSQISSLNIDRNELTNWKKTFPNLNYSQVKSEIDNLKTQISHKDNKNNSLSTQVKSLQARNDYLTSQNSSLQSQINNQPKYREFKIVKVWDDDWNEIFHHSYRNIYEFKPSSMEFGNYECEKTFYEKIE